MLAFASQHCGAAVSSPFLLDDFSTVRYNSAVPADLLWECLSNNGGGTTNCHHENGAYVSSGGIGHYVHFFPIPYVWPTGFMQHYIRSGTFSANTNRLVFWTKGGITWDATGAANIGTYSRPHASGDYPNSGQGWHFYHQHNGTMYADRWTKWQLNPHPNGLQGGGGSYYPSNEPIIADHGTTTKYFDGMTRWYIDITGQPGATTNYIANVHGAVVTGEEQFDACCGNLTITYSGTFYHVAFSAPKGTDNTFEVRYSNQDMHVAGFASGTSGGTIAATGTDYVYVRWNSPNMAVQPHFYVAIRRVGDTDFGQIYLKNGGADPYDADGIVQQVGGSTYTVTPSAGPGGTISPNTAQTINSGSTTTFTVTPNSGHTASVGGTCGGSLVGTTYTTNAIAANCTVAATFADTQAPTTPTDLDADSPSTSSVLFRWQPSTDNVGVTEYRIQSCSGFGCSSWAQIGTSTTTSYTHSGLTPSSTPTIYRYRVVAADAAGNVSGTPTSIYFNARPTIPAFPGAEGAGATAMGGRGGTIYRVTSLSGGTEAGTLRACAVVATGPRTCVFDVSGNIELSSHINVSSPYLTIAGHTAPGGGITVSGKNSTAVSFTARTHNIIVRGIRFRKGYNAGTPSQDGDSANVAGVSATSGPIGPIIFDHISASWGQDENAEVWSDVARAPKNITYQWSMIYEPLLAHPVNLLTGASSSAVADNMTDLDLHHSILANSSHRNPMIKTRSFRVVNSLVYNWSDWALAVHGTGQVDIIGNKFKTGPLYLTESAKAYEIEATPIGNSTTATTGTTSIYVTGNVGPHNLDPLADNWVMTRLIDLEINGSAELGPLSESYRRLTPLPALPFPITAQDVASAETAVLAGAGASRRLDCAGNWVSNRDSADTRVVAEYTAGNAGIVPINEDAVGGYPTLAAGTACTDTDGDGMPDTWETANGLNASSASDGPTLHASGYSNLEMYLAGPSSETTPVLSNLLPTSNLARTATSATLQATTDQIATCRYALGSGIPYAGMTLFSNTASTTHSSSVSVVAGGVYQYCVRCMGTSLVSDESCTRFAVDPNPKKRVRH